MQKPREPHSSASQTLKSPVPQSPQLSHPGGRQLLWLEVEEDLEDTEEDRTLLLCEDPDDTDDTDVLDEEDLLLPNDPPLLLPPSSLRHCALQPSPFIVFPSSHISPVSTVPLPHLPGIASHFFVHAGMSHTVQLVTPLHSSSFLHVIAGSG